MHPAANKIDQAIIEALLVDIVAAFRFGQIKYDPVRFRKYKYLMSYRSIQVQNQLCGIFFEILK